MLRGGIGDGTAQYVPRRGAAPPKKYQPAPRPKKKDVWRSLEEFQSYLALNEAVPTWCELEGVYRIDGRRFAVALAAWYGCLKVCRALRVSEEIQILHAAGHHVSRVIVHDWLQQPDSPIGQFGDRATSP